MKQVSVHASLFFFHENLQQNGTFHLIYCFKNPSSTWKVMFHAFSSLWIGVIWVFFTGSRAWGNNVIPSEGNWERWLYIWYILAKVNLLWFYHFFDDVFLLPLTWGFPIQWSLQTLKWKNRSFGTKGAAIPVLTVSMDIYLTPPHRPFAWYFEYEYSFDVNIYLLIHFLDLWTDFFTNMNPDSIFLFVFFCRGGSQPLKMHPKNLGVAQKFDD